MAFLDSLYQLITSPIHFTTNNHPFRYKEISVLCLLIGSLSLLSGKPAYAMINTTLLMMLGLALLSGIHAIIIDFFAQCLHYRGQSLALFTGLNATLIIFGLFPAIATIDYYLPTLSPFLSLLQVACTTLMLYWQCHLIKDLYKTSIKQSILLLLSPYLFTIGVIITSLLLLRGSL